MLKLAASLLVPLIRAGLSLISGGKLFDRVGERWSRLISLRHDGGRERPRYGQLGIVERDRYVFRWVVWAIDPVGDVGGVLRA